MLLCHGVPKRVMLLVMADRGHRELPIQPDFCWRRVSISNNETIHLLLEQVDGEEGVLLLYQNSIEHFLSCIHLNFRLSYLDI